MALAPPQAALSPPAGALLQCWRQPPVHTAAPAARPVPPLLVAPGQSLAAATVAASLWGLSCCPRCCLHCCLPGQLQLLSISALAAAQPPGGDHEGAKGEAVAARGPLTRLRQLPLLRLQPLQVRHLRGRPKRLPALAALLLPHLQNEAGSFAEVEPGHMAGHKSLLTQHCKALMMLGIVSKYPLLAAHRARRLPARPSKRRSGVARELSRATASCQGESPGRHLGRRSCGVPVRRAGAMSPARRSLAAIAAPRHVFC